MTTCLFSILFMFTEAQADSSQALWQKFDEYRKQVLQEKLFLHTDKSFYLTGEILWFKIYDVDAFFHMPLAISSVAYVEVLDRNNQSVLNAKLSLNKGNGNGSIYLPATLNSGNYKLRAYTNWMKNFAPDYFFEKSVTIINPQAFNGTDTGQKIVKYNIGFFPEGGNLVNSLQSKVAFRVANQYGQGIDCEGILLDNHQDTILTFHSYKLGIGSFNFTPEEQNTYKAVIRFSDGEQVVKDLPPAYATGYVMHLKPRENGKLEISIQEPAGSAVQNGQLVYLFIHTRESIKWVGSKSVQDRKAVFLIDSSRFGDGISQLTVFNNDREPVCERLYFTYPKKKLHLELKTDQSAYESRAKLNIHIYSGDQDGNPLAADLSMAVYRLDSLQTLDEMNIDNYLWLTSDLTGNVESPGYYFKDRGPESEMAMDNLMLTQGWRRFNWEDVLHDRKPVFKFPPEYLGHIISGKIINNKSGLPGKNMDAFISVPGVNTQFRNALSDDQGLVKFEMKNFFGSREIIVQTNSQKDSEYRVDISSPFVENYSTAPLPFFSIQEKNLHSLLYASINSQVQNLYLDSNLHRFSMPSIDTSAFYSEPDDRYMLDNYTRFTTLEEIITEYVQGVAISKRDGRLFFSLTDEFYRGKFVDDPLVLLDGVPVFDEDKFINNYDPLKISKLEVLKKKYFYGYRSFDGILNFTTYHGDLAGYELDPNAIALDYDGLQTQRQFYSPEYPDEPQISSHVPDFRNLLYWSPEIKTGPQGTQEANFYTSDLPGKYAIFLQGLDSCGRTGSQVLFFEVRGKLK
jgi:hypothetical protein